MVAPAAARPSLVQSCSKHYNDPLGFVYWAFPWGKKGTSLVDAEGPDVWQSTVLEVLGEQLRDRLVDDTEAISAAIRIAVASGHGIGKTALVAWLILWFISTRPNPQIVVTANTDTQLRTKTWRELSKWHDLSLNREWFQWTATQLKFRADPSKWYATAIPWSESNPTAFQGTHERHVLIIMDEACHDDQTDVMTDQGWCRFADLNGTERLLTMDPETREARYQRPTRLYAMPYIGPMHYYCQRGADFAVTPKHKMVLRTPDGHGGLGEYRRVEAQDLSRCEHRFPRSCRWIGEERATFCLPAYIGKRKRFEARTLPMRPWLSFLGWYASEGHLAYYPDGRANTTGITNHDRGQVASIARTIRALGFRPRIYRVGDGFQVRIGDLQVANWLAQWGRGALNKQVPDFIRSLPPDQIDVFLEAYCAGDGYLKNGRRIFYTSSQAMADSLQELLLKTGRGASLSERRIAGQQKAIGDHIATSSVNGYVVRETLPNDISYRPSNMEVRPYRGMVYCAEVPPHHTLLTRRRGYVLWSGNSEIADVIWDTTEGALTTAGSANAVVWLAFGNPTSNTGRFRECWTKFRRRWITLNIDSRTARMTNKKLLQEWVDDYGEDSDFVRVRVRGEFPRQGPTQFISSETVGLAVQRHIPIQLITPQTPKLMGVDVARQGDDESVIIRRWGPKVIAEDGGRLLGYRVPDLMKVASYVGAEINKWRPDSCFIDAVGMGQGVYDRLVQLGYGDIVVPCYGGNKSDVLDPTIYYNPRIEWWARMKEWLKTADIPDHRQLQEDLIGPQYSYDMRMLMRLERKEDMKKRGIPSPDYADALAMTFAFPVPVKRSEYREEELEPEVV